MIDEPNKTDEQPGDEWKMPEPIFRSSEGYRPGSPRVDPQEDIPTDPGFESEDGLDTAFGSESHGGDTNRAEEPGQHVRASTKTRVRHKKKSGCAKTFGLIAGVVAVSIAALLIVLIYFAFYYRPSQTTF